MYPLNPEVKKVAQKLCDAEGFAESASVMIELGLTIPKWFTYLSRAEQLVRERKAFEK